MSQSHYGPIGSIDDHTVVETPFDCEYGYNLHLGKDTIIEKGCVLQDGATITIGDRCVVGPGVRFVTVTADPYWKTRKGSQGEYVTGAITVHEDVKIGAGSIICPFVTIGKGAVIKDGSVVERVRKQSLIHYCHIDIATDERTIGRQKIRSGWWQSGPIHSQP